MTEDELKNWVTAYLEAVSIEPQISPDHELYCAVEKFLDSEINSPEDCWAAIQIIARLELGERIKGIVSAGPLEELIEVHGRLVIDRIEAEAESNAKFKELLQGVWEVTNSEVWRRVQVARS